MRKLILKVLNLRLSFQERRLSFWKTFRIRNSRNIGWNHHLEKAVRIPGEKAKIAVDALDERIDPVGACVGVKGSRIHGVVRELRNENIDVIQWSKNPEVLVKRALGGVEINKVEINEEDHYALVYAPVEEISKIIGKQGQNIKLASWLT